MYLERFRENTNLDLAPFYQSTGLVGDLVIDCLSPGSTYRHEMLDSQLVSPR
jgi:hypothetical protein